MFADLTDEECDAVAATCKSVEVPPGGTLFREGEAGTALLIVVSGSLEVRVKTPSGQEGVLRRVGPGDVIGELSFFDSKPRSATLTSTEGAALISFSRDAMRKFRRDSVRITAAIHRGILKCMAHRLRDLAAKSSEGIASTRNVPMERSATLPVGLPVTAIELSTKYPQLARYSAEDFALLAEVGTMRTFGANDVVMEQGKRGNACWLLLTGEVVASDKANATLATLGPGTLLGQLALVDGTVRDTTVTARVPSTALEVRAPAFAQLVAGHSPMSLRFQEQVALAGVTHVRAATTRIVAERSKASVGASRTMEWDQAGVDGLELERQRRPDPR